MSMMRRLRTGGDTGAYCTRCKMDLTHTILALAGDDLPERVRCNTCGSEHRYIVERSAPRVRTERPDRADRPDRTDRTDREGSPHAAAPRIAREVSQMEPDELVAALRDLLEAAGATAPAAIGQRWEGGTLVLRPGKPGLADKEVPIETFFRKIVMIRDRLRVLEQQINANAAIADADKLGLQQYITKCYGSLTTFNVLFDSRDDWFVGEKKSDG